MKDSCSDLVGEIIHARLEKGWTQAELAQRVGLKQSAIARLEVLETQKKVQNLIRAIEDGSYSKLLMEQLNKNETRLTELNLKLSEAPKNKKSVNISEEMLTDYLQDAKQKLYSENDDSVTKSLIQNFVDKIYINQNQAALKPSFGC